MAEVSCAHSRLNIVARHFDPLKGKLMPRKSLRVIVYCLCEMSLQGRLPLFLSKISQMFTKFNGMAFWHFRRYDEGEFIVSNC